MCLHPKGDFVPELGEAAALSTRQRACCLCSLRAAVPQLNPKHCGVQQTSQDWQPATSESAPAAPSHLPSSSRHRPQRTAPGVGACPPPTRAQGWESRVTSRFFTWRTLVAVLRLAQVALVGRRKSSRCLLSVCRASSSRSSAVLRASLLSCKGERWLLRKGAVLAATLPAGRSPALPVWSWQGSCAGRAAWLLHWSRFGAS